MRVVVLISGGGSNLQALIDAQQAGSLPITIAAVISNKSTAGGLTRAAKHNIPTQVVDHTQFDNREAFDQELQKVIDHYQPELVVLAGFMRILTPAFTNHYLGRMLNIHPSLLPKYQGLHTHQRALDAGDNEAGVTVHFVTAELDGGPLVAQARVPIVAEDDADTIAAKVLVEEHKIYPAVVKLFAQGRLSMEGGKALIDGEAVKL
ncbi:phosphoribosylglycinamide formyltransferase [Teredinibacter waterburyi]|jgi:formyltetrahydrofolate-dependent phosphoribosylglycinamide formyltransferase (EC 2.1.2.2)|uniref:phosphoribosylglycinamide formyltransferase n=1 Tax=Teredinibacter waterburyi TaxID=1500538 RepID=UPI00165FC509|nr:phosphoribosylglycinamide formyltransferase [Teredinibacter waterburyi]